MSRQRLRTGMIEGSTCSCPTCQGTGFVRSTESVALSVLRGLEDWLRTNQPANLNALTSTEVALYILNQKRGYLNDIEHRYGVSLGISASDRVFGGSFHIEKISPAIPPQQPTGVSMAVTQMEYEEPAEDEAVEPAEAGSSSDSAEGGEDDPRRSRRRRRRRGGRGEGAAEANDTMNGVAAALGRGDENAADDAEEAGEPTEQRQGASPEDDEEGGQRRRSRRRGRRGGRHQRARQMREDGDQTATESAEEAGDPAGMAAAEGEAEQHPAIGEQHPDSVETYPANAEQHPGSVETHPAEAEPEQRPAAMAMAEEKPLPFAEPVEEAPREPEMKERRGYLNGNGAHAEASSGENAPPAEEDLQPQTPKAHETAAAAEPKPRGNRRGWWQRR